MLKNQQELLLSYYHIPFITIPRLRCWVRLFCQESIHFTYFKAKFPQWMIYFSFKNGHLQKKNILYIQLLFPCLYSQLWRVPKKVIIFGLFTQKRSLKCSVWTILIFCVIWCVYFSFKDWLELRTLNFLPESVSIQ